MTDTVERPALVGNCWVLVGGIFYLTEWVAILGSAAVGIGEFATFDLPQEDLLDSYVGNVDAVAMMAGWFSLCLLGRVLLFVGLRTALADSGMRHPLMDFAVVASAVSVTLEVATYAVATAAADLANPDDVSAMVVLDRAAAWMNTMLIGGLGVAVLCSVWCMWRSGLFSMPLNVLGLVSGIGIVGAQLTISPSMVTLNTILWASPLLFWVWMLWAGVVLWRRTPRTSDVPTDTMVQP